MAPDTSGIRPAPIRRGPRRCSRPRRWRSPPRSWAPGGKLRPASLFQGPDFKAADRGRWRAGGSSAQKTAKPASSPAESRSRAVRDRQGVSARRRRRAAGSGGRLEGKPVSSPLRLVDRAVGPALPARQRSRPRSRCFTRGRCWRPNPTDSILRARGGAIEARGGKSSGSYRAQGHEEDAGGLALICPDLSNGIGVSACSPQTAFPARPADLPGARTPWSCRPTQAACRARLDRTASGAPIGIRVTSHPNPRQALAQALPGRPLLTHQRDPRAGRPAKPCRDGPTRSSRPFRQVTIDCRDRQPSRRRREPSTVIEVDGDQTIPPNRLIREGQGTIEGRPWTSLTVNWPGVITTSSTAASTRAARTGSIGRRESGWRIDWPGERRDVDRAASANAAVVVGRRRPSSSITVCVVAPNESAPGRSRRSMSLFEVRESRNAPSTERPAVPVAGQRRDHRPDWDSMWCRRRFVRCQPGRGTGGSRRSPGPRRLAAVGHAELASRPRCWVG